MSPTSTQSHLMVTLFLHHEGPQPGDLILVNVGRAIITRLRYHLRSQRPLPSPGLLRLVLETSLEQCNL